MSALGGFPPERDANHLGRPLHCHSPSTWLVRSEPDEQALPAETAMPIPSKRISCAVADLPGMR
jgi:hypothetical protein